MLRSPQPLISTMVGLLSIACSCQSGDRDRNTKDPNVVPGWEVTFDGVVCRHPDVRPQCKDGWCSIPSGCFLMGSPETEFARGLNTEELTAVTLTRSFLIGEREVTQAQWTALELPNPSGTAEYGRDCMQPECPVGQVTWFDAVAFGNLMSQRHSPPLNPCYELSGCTGDLGRQLACTSVKLTTPTLYECDGFRLPTEAEWEYAARAGSRTAFYTGDIATGPDPSACVPEPNLDAIAWYCQDASDSTHPTAAKRPNAWGLFDVLGNANERVHDDAVSMAPAGPLVDPAGTYEPRPERVKKGGLYNGWSGVLRAASRLVGSADLTGPGIGFRLVRTATVRHE